MESKSTMLNEMFLGTRFENSIEKLQRLPKENIYRCYQYFVRNAEDKNRVEFCGRLLTRS